MTDEIAESAKAVQEVAKTTSQAISTVEKIGNFFSRIMAESIDATCGMLADSLKFKRWERQISLIEKAEKKIKEKNLSNKIRPVAPKLAIPIFKGASLEDDESLHDIWANLLVTSLNPSSEIPRNCFIDIIRQLEPIDVKILNFLYRYHSKKSEESKKIEEDRLEKQKDRILRDKYGDDYDEKTFEKEASDRLNKFLRSEHMRIIASEFPSDIYLRQESFMKELNIDYHTYWTSIDNLFRQRLITSHIAESSIETAPDDEGGRGECVITYDLGYSAVCITALGVSFVKACTIID